MAHWTLELARAVIAGDSITGPWPTTYTGDAWKGDVRHAWAHNATLNWDASHGHRGSVVLVFDDEPNRCHEVTFLDLALGGWVPTGDDRRLAKRRMRAQIRKNEKGMQSVKRQQERKRT